MKNSAAGFAGYVVLAAVFSFMLPAGAAGVPVKDDLAGSVVWPEEYILDIHRPESLIRDVKAYLPNVVQNLIADELSLQRSAVTRDKVRPAVIEYSVQKDHENLPAEERKNLLAKQPKPPILPLKIVRRSTTPANFRCEGLSEENYALLTRISAKGNRLKLEVLLCQGTEVLLSQTTDADEQELVAGVNRLINPVRAKLTGDRYASLNITTNPGRASVYLDGQFLGKTPLKYSYLVPGKYELVLKLDRYEMARHPVDAKVGETFSNSYDLALAKAIGTIEVESDPQGAKIYLDADYKGTTPMKIENVPAGTYRVHVLNPDKGEIYKSVTISEKSPVAKVSGSLSEFAYQKSPGFIGLSYKTWYWISLVSAAISFGTAIGFYVWRDQAQEDIYNRLNGKAVSLYTQQDYDYISDRNSAGKTRESFATGFMVGAGVMAIFSIYFYVQHLLSADEGIVRLEKPRSEGDVDIRLGGMIGQAAVSADFRF
ncbi:MAG: PEGA domain-containing protein [Spirochaetes bacterium]|nr:PEGA domain-containing protein [Spirochaetota bacterium]